MTDAEFADELVTRLNLLLEADQQRAHAVFTTPLAHAAYASVGHFVSQLALPRHLTKEASADAVKEVKFIAPVIRDQKIVKFEALTGDQLQKRHVEAAEAADKAKGPKVH